MSFYRGQRVLVTGGSGFLARHLVPALLEAGAAVRIACRKPVSIPNVEVLLGDLTQKEICTRAVESMDCVFHLAAFGWGLVENLKHQPQLLTQNILLNTQMLEAAYRAGVQRYLFTSSSSVYPSSLTILEEDAPWDAPPHGSELYFGWAKRMGEVQARAYHEHYGMKIAIVRPTNPYGPWDSVDPKTSHVIPALIARALAKERPFKVWGSGKAVRSFVHARDVARGMMLALERDPVSDPLNLAAEETTSVGELARRILELSGNPTAELTFDPTKPEGHPRKVPSITKARDKIGFIASTPLRDGLLETIRWYQSHV